MFPRVKRLGRESDNYFYLVQSLRMSGTVPPHPYMPPWRGWRHIYVLRRLRLCETRVLGENLGQSGRKINRRMKKIA
jgi:hypothetical protein